MAHHVAAIAGELCDEGSASGVLEGGVRLVGVEQLREGTTASLHLHHQEEDEEEEEEEREGGRKRID